MNAVVLDKVSFSYPDKPVFDSLSLRADVPSRTALIGPSGAGKTTVLRLIAGLETPSGGKVDVPRGSSISYVFQEDRLLEHLNALENLRFAAGKKCGSELLRELDLTDEDIHRPVHFYSGGMKRRVAIARALAVKHDILLLDEPFKGLDAALREKAARLVLRSSGDKTILLVTHDRDDLALLDIRDTLTL